MESPSFGDRSSARKLALPSPPSKETKDLDFLLLGSYNGLVFACFRKESYCLWNPTTGFFQGLPDPEFAHPEDVHFLHHGIGYVSETDEYKVILSVDFFSGQEVRIFSLRDQIWKVMESPCGFVIEGQGVPLHETLHWVYREGEEFNDQNESFAVIIAFDLTTEEFREMPLPVAWLQEEDSWVVLFSCRGCLCLWKYGMRAASASVECWVMETYGVTDSWTRGPNFSISNPPELIRFLRPLLVTETSRVLLRNSADGELELVKIDDQEGNQEEEIVTYMHGWNHGWFVGGTHMIVYEETLRSYQVMEPIQPGIRVKKTQNAAQRPHRAQMMIVIAGLLLLNLIDCPVMHLNMICLFSAMLQSLFQKYFMLCLDFYYSYMFACSLST